MQCSLLSDISVGLVYITSLLYSHSFVYPFKRACASTQTQQPTDYRMTLKIRKATEEDEASVSRICLLTADAGASATALHDFGELPGAASFTRFLMSNSPLHGALCWRMKPLKSLGTS
jgi:hypothetical protein